MAKEKGRGEVFTLNEWDRPGRERGKGADRDVMGRGDKWKTIDVSYDVGDAHMGGEREGLTGC